MLTWEKGRNAALVKLTGDVDHRVCEAVRLEIDEVLSDTAIRTLILDMDGVDFMDSSGIGLVLGRQRILAARGGKLCVKCGRSAVDRIFRVSGLYKLVEKVDGEVRP